MNTIEITNEIKIQVEHNLKEYTVVVWETGPDGITRIEVHNYENYETVSHMIDLYKNIPSLEAEVRAFDPSGVEIVE